MAIDVNFYSVVAKDGQSAAARFDTLTKDAKSFYIVGSDLYIGGIKISNDADLKVAVSDIATNAADIATINNTLTKLENTEETAGSIRAIIKSYLEDLDVDEFALASVSDGVVTIKGIKEVDGEIAVGTDTTKDVTLAKAATTGASEDISYDNSTSGLTATDVKTAIDEVASASAGGVNSKTVYVTETIGASGDAFSKRYGIYQGATGSTASPVASEKLVDIDIAKDMVVESGTVETVTVDDQPYIGAKVGDKYIDLVIANASSDHIYIPANSLVDIYKAEKNATQIQLTIDANNEISAEIVDGSVDTDALGALAVTTAKIADGAVTKTKLAQSVQNSLDLADSALQASDITTGSVAGAIMVSGSTVPVAGLATVATSGSAADVAYVNGSIATVTGALDDIYNQIGAGGSVAQQIQDAIEDLDGSAGIASKVGNTVTIKAGISEVDGVVSNNTGDDITLADVASTGAAADVSVADTGGNFASVSKNVETILAEIANHLTWTEV